MKYQKDALEKFPLQIDYVLNSYVRHNLNKEDYKNIVLCGLGGSGIAGRIVKSFFQKISSIPIEVISDYNLPNYVNDESLVILNSYSGNTEETLAMYMDALEKQSKLVVITTGGIIGDLANETNIQTYFAEKGFQPRMALGYSLTTLILIFSELFNLNLRNNLKSLVTSLKNTDNYLDKALEIFLNINKTVNKKFVIICDPPSIPIGTRFMQQIQENTKGEAFVHELPEANHNVIESYYSKLDSVFIFIDSKQEVRISNRFEFLIKLLKDNKQIIHEIDFGGYSLKEIYEIIYTLDWLSLLISDAKAVKSDEIGNINNLKSFLKNK